jgi:hypothetical protein
MTAGRHLTGVDSRPILALLLLLAGSMLLLAANAQYASAHRVTLAICLATARFKI